MLRFAAGRAGQALFALFVVSVAVFFLARLSGSPVDLFLGDFSTEEDRVRLEAALGVDESLLHQYRVFVTDLIHGDFGTSLSTRRPALDLVLERLPATLQLGGVAFLFSICLAIPLGVIAATRRGTRIDALVRSMAILGQAMPIFVSGLIAILIFGVWWPILPAGGSGSLLHLLLPAVTLGFYNAAGLMRITRSSMLEVLDTEYVKLLRAKGVPERRIVWRHALKNAAIPITTFATILLVTLVSGTIVAETVFAWPGVGRLVLQGVLTRDYPVVQTIVMMLAALYIVANLVADILYAVLNPKVRVS